MAKHARSIAVDTMRSRGPQLQGEAQPPRKLTTAERDARRRKNKAARKARKMKGGA
jgi:hypothetical protein